MDEPLQLTIGGHQVEGRFLHRSDSFIEVEITAPYRGFRESLHLASFSRKRLPRGFREEEGESSGRRLLRTLFRIAAYVEKNRRRLIEAYQEYHILERQMPHGINDEFFVAIREEHKAHLEAGEISKQEYRRRLTQVRISHSEYHERIYVMQQEFFRMNFPFKLTPRLQTQVLDYLWREFNSSSHQPGLGTSEI